MTDEHKLIAQMNRGAQAKQIFEHEFVQEAFSAIDSEILKAWSTSHADEEEVRNRAYLMQRLLKNLREQFSRAIATGEASSKELLRIKDESKIKRFMRHG
jgi:FMN-dependent NADH-azoreductase